MSAALTLPLLAALVVVAAGAAGTGRLVPARRPPGRSPAHSAARPDRRRPAATRYLGRGVTVANLAARWRRGGGAPTEVELAGWCERVARALRSGDALRTAVRTVPADDTGSGDGALAGLLAPVHLALDRGATLVDALGTGDRGTGGRARPASAASSSTGVAMVRSVLIALADLGGPGAEALDRTAAVLRQRDADASERRVQAAQARLSATVLTVLPVGTGALLLVLDGEIRRALSEPIGAVVLGLGLLLDLLGWWWMRRIVAGGP